MGGIDATQSEVPTDIVETPVIDDISAESTQPEAEATEQIPESETQNSADTTVESTTKETVDGAGTTAEPEQQEQTESIEAVGQEDEVVAQGDETQAEQAEAELVGDIDDGTKAVNDYYAKRDVLAYDISKFLLDSAAASLTVKTNVDGVDFVVQVNQLDEYGNRI